MFEPVEGSVNFPALEGRIGQFWKERQIYQQSLNRRADAERFVFFEGPPTANGLPHPGHCLTRAIKDLFPRYRTMRGYLCERKAGWDTHGLPVEVEVCKELGIHSKEEIEAYGIERFIQLCQKSVWRYMQQWERLTERLGFWVDLRAAYVTYHQTYVESVWWSLKNLFDRGLLYQGHKIVWWWAQGGTALSAGEVGQGYRQVADPSVYVRFPIVADDAAKKLGLDENTSLLVWTTTPWTLPSNQFAAVNPELEYSLVVDTEDGKKLIVASALVETLAGKAGRALTLEKTIFGRELVGLRYLPPFDYYHQQSGATRGALMAGGRQHLAWRIVAADFVTTESGSGVVHQAPAFGEDDYHVLQTEQSRFVDREGPELICAVAPDGKFTDEAPDYAGRWVKDCDRDITRELRARGLLFHQEQYLHDYPFCWRAEEDPLIQYPRRSWFVRTTEFKDRMLANNEQINWLPEHIKHGRFGNFLESNVDWALSRERYWGTPLPIWKCDECGQMEAICNYDELLAKPGVSGQDVWAAAKAAHPELPDDLRVHKPYIDAMTYDSPFHAGARMRRVTEVIDCWYDSGAMPFAQWGYPHVAGSQENFAQQFPADFISEAIDQTRGWFYSQLAISTMLFSNTGDDKGRGTTRGEGTDGIAAEFPHPFKNCIVLGLMQSEWFEAESPIENIRQSIGVGTKKRIYLSEDEAKAAGHYSQRVGKMSKSMRNYREPNEIFDKYGADALRWYFFANQAPWTSIRYSERAIKDSIPEFLLRLWNVYSFFVIYAGIDGFDPAAQIAGHASLADDQLTAQTLGKAKTFRPVSQRGELDRWIIGELHRTLGEVTARMDAYDNFAACGQINAFVDALSNWYVRRSRDRFWSADKQDRDKLDAYWTLYECLLTTCKLVAPFVPFVAEAIWKNLAVAEFAGAARESVHLCDYPACDPSLVDQQLSTRMNLVREISSLGRSARMGAKLKVRQPLAKVEVILADASQQAWLAEHAGLICEELNVKAVEFAARADQYISYTVLPDLKKLGPKLGKRLPAVKQALAKADGGRLMAELEQRGAVAIPLPDGAVELTADELQIRLEAKDGWAAAQGKACVVVLATQISPELLLEGAAREMVHAVQTCRKDRNCQYTDRIAVGVETDSAELRQALVTHGDFICGETLASQLSLGALPGVEPLDVKLGEHVARLYVKVIPS